MGHGQLYSRLLFWDGYNNDVREDQIGAHFYSEKEVRSGVCYRAGNRRWLTAKKRQLAFWGSFPRSQCPEFMGVTLKRSLLVDVPSALKTNS